MESLVSLAVLMIGGVCVITARQELSLLVGLLLHALALANLVVVSAGTIVAGAVLVGDVTAIAVLTLAHLYRLDLRGESSGLRSRVRATLSGSSAGSADWRKEPSIFLQGLSALLAAVVAYGLSDKPISGTPEAVSGVPSFVAYWLLAAGLVVVLLSRDHLKLGGGLLMMVNAGQMMYLASARNLETSLVAVSVAVVVAISLGVTHVSEIAARVAAADRREEASNTAVETGAQGGNRVWP